MNQQHQDQMDRKSIIGLLGNGKHNADLVLKWFGRRLTDDFGIHTDWVEKDAPSGPAGEDVYNKLDTYASAVIGTAD